MIAQLFHAPAALQTGLAAGNYMQYGTVIKDAVSGQIVAHMQPSGLAHSLFGNAMMGVTSPATMAVSQVLNASTGIYNAVQVHQIKAMVETLQALQIATLSVSLIGVGVSAAGFAYMHKRFNVVDKKIDQLMDSVTSGFKDQQKATLRSHVSQVAGLIQQATQAHTLSNTSREYSRISEALASEAAHFEGELEFVVKVSGKINLELFWQLAQTLMTCNSARIDCRLKTNELRNALTVAEGVAYSYQNLFGSLTPISFDASQRDNAATVIALKDITDVASTKPYLIDHLHSRRIDGPSYLNRLETEVEQPLLMLKVS